MATIKKAPGAAPVSASDPLPEEPAEVLTEKAADRPLSAGLFLKVTIPICTVVFGGLGALYLKASSIDVSVGKLEAQVVDLGKQADRIEGRVGEATKTLGEVKEKQAAMDVKLGCVNCSPPPPPPPPHH